MIRLGLRLAASGGQSAIARVALTALAVAIGTAILLFALSFKPALDDRGTRAAWWDASHLLADGEQTRGTGLWMYIATDRVGAEELRRVLVAPIDDAAPVPPGIPRLPAQGEAFVSPALAARMDALPADQLGDRIGPITGLIGDEALRSPDELIAVVGADPAMLREVGAFSIQAFPTQPRVPDLPPMILLLVVLAVAGALAPVIVFVSTATRLSAARRDQRLAALRLVGGSSRQVAQLAAVESIVPTLLGAVGAVGLFLVTRPLVAKIPLDGSTWFPESIAPPMTQAVAVLLAVPVVGVVTAVVTLRRIVVTPLGVQRRETPPPPGVARLVPLGLSLLVLFGLLGWEGGRNLGEMMGLIVAGLSFAGIIGGIALAGPWLTAIVGHALRRGPGGAATLLAARRLSDDPRGSFGAIAGVIMAVFVASAFFTFSAYGRVQAGAVTGLLQPGDIAVDLPVGFGDPAEGLADRLAAIDGVTGTLPVRAGEVQQNGSLELAWLASCDAVVARLPLGLTTCSGAAIHSRGLELSGGSAGWTPDRPDAAGVRREIPFDVPAEPVAQLSSDGSPVFNWLPAYILDPAAFPELVEASGVSRIMLSSNGDPAVVERVRTTVINAFPTAFVSGSSETFVADPMFAELERVVHIGLLGTMILAGCSLAVAVTTGVLDRRRQFALLRSAGMPVGRLRAVVLLQAAAPLLAVASFSGALGVAVAQGILVLATTDEIPLPDASLFVTLALSVVGALGVVALTLPPLERMTRPETARAE